MKIIFRVECNNGSKYFDNCFEAMAFYNLKREQVMTNVQLWKFVTPNTQELITPLPKK